MHVLAGLPLLIVLMIGRILPAMGQQLAPRAYAIAPINSTALILGFSYLDGGLQFQGGAPITGATAKVDLPALGLYRTFSLFGRAASATFDVPYGIGQFRGTVLELPRHLALSGLLDASLRVSVNLLGGPAMTAWEFAHWQQTTLVGASLTVVGPTGQYDPTRLVNFGSNRWAFKVELGYSRRWRHWLFDAYGGGWFFTTDPEYFSHNQYFPGTRSQSETPAATSNSPTRGQVKFPHLTAAGSSSGDDYARAARLARRSAASFSRQLLPSNFSRFPWCMMRSSKGVTMTTSPPSSFGQSSGIRFEVMTVEAFS